MQIAIELTSFYPPGDERRFFDGLAELDCIENVRGIGRALVLAREHVPGRPALTLTSMTPCPF
jgi:hypothetical protein